MIAGGALTIESEVGVGSSFHLAFLPRVSYAIGRTDEMPVELK
jgi:hypothetical protein